jgi:hypothetical protein
MMPGHGVASKSRSAVPRVLTSSVLAVAEPLLGSAQGSLVLSELGNCRQPRGHGLRMCGSRCRTAGESSAPWRRHRGRERSW